MKKKISLLLCLVMLAFGLAACGSTETDYYGMTYDYLESVMENVVESLGSMSTDELVNYEANGTDEVMIKLVRTWREATEDLGAYEGLGEFTVTKAQTTVTLEQLAEFEEREVSVTYVLEYNYSTEQLELTDANADVVYTLGEKMGKAGMNTLMGMGTVFCVLILISLIIYCFKLIPYFQDMMSGKKKSEKKVEQAAQAAPPAAQPVVEQADDLELIAVISAAIAASEGTSTDGFVVRSIRRRS